MTQSADEPQSTLCGGGSGCPRLGGVPGNFQVPGNLYQVPRWLVSSDWPLPLVLSPFGCGHPIWGLRPSPARMGLQMSQRCAASGLRYCGGYEWHGCPGSLFASGSWGTLLGLPILIMKHICDKYTQLL